MYPGQFLVAAPAADPSGVTALDALGLFVGIPVVIIAVVVGAVYGAHRRTLRAEGSVPRSRTGELPPLTEPVLGNPGQPSGGPDRERPGDAGEESPAAPVSGRSPGPRPGGAGGGSRECR